MTKEIEILKNVFPSTQSKTYPFKDDAINLHNVMLWTPVFSFLPFSHDNGEIVFSQEVT